MRAGPDSGGSEALAGPPVTTCPYPGGPEVPLSYVDTSHKWLGAMWSPSLDFAADLHARLGCADAVMVQLVGLVSANILPITLAMELFVIKVDSMLASQRWLWITVRRDGAKC